MKPNFKALFPFVVTPNITESAAFYQEHFGFDVVYDEDWYKHLMRADGYQLGFLTPNLEGQPKEVRAEHSGKGFALTFEVDNIEESLQYFKDQGVQFTLEYTEEEWGQRHFVILDPSGTSVDIVQQTKPEDHVD